MTFEEAYSLMEQGKAISLPELIPYNVFYYLSGGFEISRDKVKNSVLYEYYNNNPKYKNSLDTRIIIDYHIDMKDARGHLVIGVQISDKDKSRDDWVEFNVLNE